MSQYSETKRVTECGWRHAPEARGGLCENLKEVRELRMRRQTRRIDFWSSRAWGEPAPYGGRTRRGPNEQDNIEDCVSPPYVETFNSKVKRFRTWTRSRSVFSNSEIPMFFICSIVINIRCPFHPFCTWPYSCIWLHNRYRHASTSTRSLPITGQRNMHFRRLWNGMFDRHRAEITVMQFTGHSLPVHHFVTARWDLHLVPYCQPSCILHY